MCVFLLPCWAYFAIKADVLPASFADSCTTLCCTSHVTSVNARLCSNHVPSVKIEAFIEVFIKLCMTMLFIGKLQAVAN